MKSYIITIVFIILSLFAVPGCYTVVWEPDMEFPDEYNSEYSTDTYYGESDYGNYSYFYNYPWWFNLDIPTKERTVDRDKNPSINALRNDGNGRTTSGSRGTDILVTPPPSKDGSNGNSTSNEGSNSGSTDRTVKTETNRSNNSGNTSNPVRNNDGNRTSDGKKR
jgi:hypothetical protein